jgi:hypothetical protein
MLSVSVFSNPARMERATISVAVPRATPATDIQTMNETNRLPELSAETFLDLR